MTKPCSFFPGFDDIAPLRRRPFIASHAKPSSPIATPNSTSPSIRDLNAEQSRAATAPLDRHCLVISGAGTGKTKTVVARFKHLRSSGVPASRILTIAFNKDAADEMAERIKTATGVSPQMNGTFHSIGRRILAQIPAPHGMPKHTVINDAESRRMIRDILSDLKLSSKLDADEALQAIRHWQDLGAEPSKLVHSGPKRKRRCKGMATDDAPLPAALVYDEFQSRKRSAGKIDFGDMILLPVSAMRNDPQIRLKFASAIDHILTDEYQDINDAQYDLIHLLASDGARLFCVGDDDQAIYRFRNARIEHILNFQKDHPDAIRVDLVINYRCTPEIIAIANRLAAGLSARLAGKSLEAFRPSATKPIIASFDTRADEAAAVSQAIVAIRKNQGQTSQVAVLARLNRSLRSIEDQLAKAGIPFAVKGGSFWSRPEILDLLAYLEAVDDIDAADSIARVVNVPMRFIGRQTVSALVAASRAMRCSVLDPAAAAAIKGPAATRVLSLVTQIARWRQMIVNGDPIHFLLSTIIAEIDYWKHWRQEPETIVERMENVTELIEAAREFVTIKSLLDHARLARDKADRPSADPTNSVALSTIHRAKGLEWDHVFIVSFDEAVLPYTMASSPSDIDEERRLAYVAVSRARDRLYMSFSRAPTGPSPFIREIADLARCTTGFSDRKARIPAAGKHHHLPAWAITLGVSTSVSNAGLRKAYHEHLFSAGTSSDARETMVSLHSAYQSACAWLTARQQSVDDAGAPVVSVSRKSAYRKARIKRSVKF